MIDPDDFHNDPLLQFLAVFILLFIICYIVGYH
jgi:hypothetical protein